ncbi:MAG TPA: hypothetical protein VFW45_18840 [Candidatus Polarisedimenticolia bacterium]|nr:hypothetical protein [Candidatus Polarisedimenticolia bacterium]
MSVRRLLCLAILAMIAPLSAAGWAADTKPAAKKPQTKPAAKAAPQTQTAPAPENQPVQSKEGVTIRENYFMELPGIDLTTLTPKQKQRYLDRVNQELCTCGCPNDTIAHCLVNDPKCPTVRGIAEKVLSEVKAGK